MLGPFLTAIYSLRCRLIRGLLPVHSQVVFWRQHNEMRRYQRASKAEINSISTSPIDQIAAAGLSTSSAPHGVPSRKSHCIAWIMTPLHRQTWSEFGGDKSKLAPIPAKLQPLRHKAYVNCVMSQHVSGRNSGDGVWRWRHHLRYSCHGSDGGKRSAGRVRLSASSSRTNGVADAKVTREEVVAAQSQIRSVE